MARVGETYIYPVIAGAFVALAAACGGEGGDGGVDRPPAGEAREESWPAPAAAGTGDGALPSGEPVPMGERAVVLVVGTSLTAGLGVDPGDAYPARLQERIDEAGLPLRVVNAGVSGETSAGARARIDWLLQQDPAVVVLETGANDGLRGLDPAALGDNIEAIVGRIRAELPETHIALVQMEAPPNYGRAYTARFRETYADLASEYDLTLLPFPLAQVAGVDSLNQPDGIHPTPAGHRLMAGAIWPALEPVLREAATARPGALR